MSQKKNKTEISPVSKLKCEKNMKQKSTKAKEKNLDNGSKTEILNKQKKSPLLMHISNNNRRKKDDHSRKTQSNNTNGPCFIDTSDTSKNRSPSSFGKASDSDFLVISEADSEKTSVHNELSDIIQSSISDSRLSNQSKSNTSAKSINFINNSHPSHHTPEVSLRSKCNVTVDPSDNLHITENDKLIHFESTFRPFDTLSGIEINHDFVSLMESNTAVSDVLTSSELCPDYAVSDINTVAEDAEQIAIKDCNLLHAADFSNSLTPKEYVLFFINRLSPSVGSKENFICNQLKMEPLIKPPGFNYDQNSIFDLAVDVGMLRAANEHFKRGVAETFLEISPSDAENVWEHSFAKSGDLYWSCDQISEDPESDVSISSCRTADILPEFFDVTFSESPDNIENPESTSENFHIEALDASELIMSDLNIGANEICSSNSEVVSSETSCMKAINNECSTEVPQKVKKKRKRTICYPRKRSRKRNANVSKLDKLKEDICSDTCDDSDVEEPVPDSYHPKLLMRVEKGKDSEKFPNCSVESSDKVSPNSKSRKNRKRKNDDSVPNLEEENFGDTCDVNEVEEPALDSHPPKPILDAEKCKNLSDSCTVSSSHLIDFNDKVSPKARRRNPRRKCKKMPDSIVSKLDDPSNFCDTCDESEVEEPSVPDSYLTKTPSDLEKCQDFEKISASNSASSAQLIDSTDNVSPNAKSKRNTKRKFQKKSDDTDDNVPKLDDEVNQENFCDTCDESEVKEPAPDSYLPKASSDLEKSKDFEKISASHPAASVHPIDSTDNVSPNAKSKRNTKRKSQKKSDDNVPKLDDEVNQENFCDTCDESKVEKPAPDSYLLKASSDLEKNKDFEKISASHPASLVHPIDSTDNVSPKAKNKRNTKKKSLKKSDDNVPKLDDEVNQENFCDTCDESEVEEPALDSYLPKASSDLEKSKDFETVSASHPASSAHPIDSTNNVSSKAKNKRNAKRKCQKKSDDNFPKLDDVVNQENFCDTCDESEVVEPVPDSYLIKASSDLERCKDFEKISDSYSASSAHPIDSTDNVSPKAKNKRNTRRKCAKKTDKSVSKLDNLNQENDTLTEMEVEKSNSNSYSPETIVETDVEKCKDLADSSTASIAIPSTKKLSPKTKNVKKSKRKCKKNDDSVPKLDDELNQEILCDTCDEMEEDTAVVDSCIHKNLPDVEKMSEPHVVSSTHVIDSSDSKQLKTQQKRVKSNNTKRMHKMKKLFSEANTKEFSHQLLSKAAEDACDDDVQESNRVDGQEKKAENAIDSFCENTVIIGNTGNELKTKNSKLPPQLTCSDSVVDIQNTNCHAHLGRKKRNQPNNFIESEGKSATPALALQSNSENEVNSNLKADPKMCNKSKRRKIDKSQESDQGIKCSIDLSVLSNKSSDDSECFDNMVEADASNAKVKSNSNSPLSAENCMQSDYSKEMPETVNNDMMLNKKLDGRMLLVELQRLEFGESASLSEFSETLDAKKNNKKGSVPLHVSNSTHPSQNYNELSGHLTKSDYGSNLTDLKENKSQSPVKGSKRTHIQSKVNKPCVSDSNADSPNSEIISSKVISPSKNSTDKELISFNVLDSENSNQNFNEPSKDLTNLDHAGSLNDLKQKIASSPVKDAEKSLGHVEPKEDSLCVSNSKATTQDSETSKGIPLLKTTAKSKKIKLSRVTRQSVRADTALSLKKQESILQLTSAATESHLETMPPETCSSKSTSSKSETACTKIKSQIDTNFEASGDISTQYLELNSAAEKNGSNVEVCVNEKQNVSPSKRKKVRFNLENTDSRSLKSITGKAISTKTSVIDANATSPASELDIQVQNRDSQISRNVHEDCENLNSEISSPPKSKSEAFIKVCQNKNVLSVATHVKEKVPSSQIIGQNFENLNSQNTSSSKSKSPTKPVKDIPIENASSNKECTVSSSENKNAHTSSEETDDKIINSNACQLQNSNEICQKSDPAKKQPKKSSKSSVTGESNKKIRLLKKGTECNKSAQLASTGDKDSEISKSEKSNKKSAKEKKSRKVESRANSKRTLSENINTSESCDVLVTSNADSDVAEERMSTNTSQNVKTPSKLAFEERTEATVNQNEECATQAEAQNYISASPLNSSTKITHTNTKSDDFKIMDEDFLDYEPLEDDSNENSTSMNNLSNSTIPENYLHSESVESPVQKQLCSNMMEDVNLQNNTEPDFHLSENREVLNTFCNMQDQNYYNFFVNNFHNKGSHSKGDLSEDDSDSDEEHSFKRARYDIRNNITGESLLNSSSSCAVEDKIPCPSEVQDVPSRPDDVVKQIRKFCVDERFTEALELAERYIAISYSHDVSENIFKKCLSSLFRHLNNKDNLDLKILENVHNLMDKFSIYNKQISSYVIFKCCRHPELTIYSVKMFHFCRDKKIPLNNGALNLYGLLLKNEEPSLPVLLDFLDFVKTICNKKLPKDLVHLALEKLKEKKKFEQSNLHDLCSILHRIRPKEIDELDLKNFLQLCFKKHMWEYVAEMFLSWTTKMNVFNYFYTALASDSENMGSYFWKFTTAVYEEKERRNPEESLSIKRKVILGQIGTALLMDSFSRNHLQIAHDIMHTIHTYNINYFDLQFRVWDYSSDEDCSPKIFPFTIIFRSIDLHLDFKRAKDAFVIFQEFSWITPSAYLSDTEKAYVLKEKYQRLLKLIPLLNNSDSLNEGWEALKILLSEVEQDSFKGILEEQKKELVSIYNKYLISLLNSEKISSAHDLYQHSLGPKKDVFVLKPAVIRGLVVAFSKHGKTDAAYSLFMYGIMQKLYSIKKPEPGSFPWDITIMSHWTAAEIKLAIEWFVGTLFPLLRDRPEEAHFEKWFSFKINFEIVEENSPLRKLASKINCLVETDTDPKSYIKKTKDVLKEMDPCLQFSDETDESALCIKSASLYSYWKRYCGIAVMPSPDESIISSRKVRLAFGSRKPSTEENTSFYLPLDTNNPNVSQSSSSLHETSAENIVFGMIGEIRANSEHSYSSVSPKNALSRMPQNIVNNSSINSILGNESFSFASRETSTPRQKLAIQSSPSKMSTIVNIHGDQYYSPKKDNLNTVSSVPLTHLNDRQTLKSNIQNSNIIRLINSPKKQISGNTSYTAENKLKEQNTEKEISSFNIIKEIPTLKLPVSHNTSITKTPSSSVCAQNMLTNKQKRVLQRFPSIGSGKEMPTLKTPVTHNKLIRQTPPSSVSLPVKSSKKTMKALRRKSKITSLTGMQNSNARPNCKLKKMVTKPSSLKPGSVEKNNLIITTPNLTTPKSNHVQMKFKNFTVCVDSSARTVSSVPQNVPATPSTSANSAKTDQKSFMNDKGNLQVQFQHDIPDTVVRVEPVKSNVQKQNKETATLSHKRPVGAASLAQPVGAASHAQPVGAASHAQPVGAASHAQLVGAASLVQPVDSVLNESSIYPKALEQKNAPSAISNRLSTANVSHQGTSNSQLKFFKPKLNRNHVNTVNKNVISQVPKEKTISESTVISNSGANDSGRIPKAFEKEQEIKKDSSYIEKLNRQSAGNGTTTCKEEDFKGIYQFLERRVALKNKNLSQEQQHNKAMRLAELFVKNNRVTVLDKKTMKSLSDFSELYV